jgi:flagellin
MTVINTNVKSLISQNALYRNSRDLSSAMEQLSTGKRINSAADDAAGLAISSRMTAQIKGLDQAVRNANDGISLLQTAEGALIEVTNMLQRMRELNVQAGNDTYTDKDRTSLSLEYKQLVMEINRIASNTQWNGMSILDNNTEAGRSIGTGGLIASPTTPGAEVRNINFQVGANANQIISIQFRDFTIPVDADGNPEVPQHRVTGKFSAVTQRSTTPVWPPQPMPTSLFRQWMSPSIASTNNAPLMVRSSIV